MRPLPEDGDIDRVVSLGSRIGHRIAAMVPTAPARFRAPTAMVSITFDDAPDSACTTGAAILEGFGARGTYYLSGSLVGAAAPFWQVADAARIAALHRAGHEIACHTHGHAFLPSLSADGIAREARANRDRLGAIVPDLTLENFAYPYGYASIGAKRALAGLYASSRGIMTGLNAGRVDRHFLRANPLIDAHMDADRIRRLMDEALARKAWLIFYGHDVIDAPSPYGCRPALLEAALRAAAARDIPCATIARASRWLR